MSITPSQQVASDGFFEFLLSDEKEMRISGPGGYGKTWLMGRLINKVMPDYLDMCKMLNMGPKYDSVEMCSTTNTSAEILGKESGRPVSTVHSFLGLTVKEDFKTGQTRLEKTRNWMVHERKIVFIDECSMIDTPLDNLIDEGTYGCKVVYVGDHCQLNPVMEKVSPIYSRQMRSYELTEPVRTNDPHLHALNLQFRKTVETGIFNDIHIVPGIIDYLSNDEAELAINEHFLEQNSDKRILAYTNDRVLEYNDHIRDIRGLPVEFMIGEKLISNSAIDFNNKTKLSIEQELEILSINPTIHSAEYPGDIKIDYVKSSIKTNYGIINDVPLVIDRIYFNDVTKYFAKQKKWISYYQLKKHFPDLRQRDAATIYKAQGNSLDIVLIDLANLSRCHNPDQVARMMYVAASRARKRIIMFGKLNPKYGQIILP